MTRVPEEPMRELCDDRHFLHVQADRVSCAPSGAPAESIWSVDVGPFDRITFADGLVVCSNGNQLRGFGV